MDKAGGLVLADVDVVMDVVLDRGRLWCGLNRRGPRPIGKVGRGLASEFGAPSGGLEQDHVGAGQDAVGGSEPHAAAVGPRLERPTGRSTRPR